MYLIPDDDNWKPNPYAVILVVSMWSFFMTFTIVEGLLSLV